VSGSSAGAEAPGSARSAVAPQPVASSAAAATSVALSLSRLNIIVPSSRGLDGRGWWAEQAITGGQDNGAIANRAVSACGHDGHCGLNVRTGIAATTSLDATMTLAGVICVVPAAHFGPVAMPVLRRWRYFDQHGTTGDPATWLKRWPATLGPSIESHRNSAR
jgi:hypothetical protein